MFHDNTRPLYYQHYWYGAMVTKKLLPTDTHQFILHTPYILERQQDLPIALIPYVPRGEIDSAIVPTINKSYRPLPNVYLTSAEAESEIAP